MVKAISFDKINETFKVETSDHHTINTQLNVYKTF